MDLFKRGMQAFFGKRQEEDVAKPQQRSLPAYVHAKDNSLYSTRTRPTLVVVQDGDKACPALLLTQELTEQLEDLIYYERDNTLRLRQVENKKQSFQSLRERLLVQLRALEAAQTQAVTEGNLEHEDQVRNRKQGLLSHLETLDNTAIIAEAGCTADRTAVYNEVMTALNDVFERANILPSFRPDYAIQPAAAPFDTGLLIAMETHGAMTGDEVVNEEAEDHSADGVELDPLYQTEPEPIDDSNFEACLERVGQILHDIDALQSDLEAHQENLRLAQQALDDQVIRLEAAGYECPTGDRSMHLQDKLDEFAACLARLRADEAELEEHLGFDDNVSQYSARIADLNERGYSRTADAFQRYSELRYALTAVGVDCDQATAARDRSDLQSQRYEEFMNSHLEILHERKKLANLQERMATAIYDYHRREYVRVIADSERDLRQYEAEHAEARRLLEEVGLCAPPSDKMPQLDDKEPSLAGSIDMADFLAANQANDDEGPGANVRKIESLPGLAEVPQEPQMTRWRYSLGGFGYGVDNPYDDTGYDPHGIEEDQEDGSHDDNPSIDADDSLSVRAGFVSEMTDQDKLAEWRAEEDKARIAFAHLEDERYEGIDGLFEEQ